MIRKLYPNGKRKAFNITYDDGILQDVRFVELLNKYNLKGTFNLNSELMKQEFEWIHPCGMTIKRLPESIVVDLYRGHEVASHSLTHPDLEHLSDEDLRYELGKDKKNLEELFGCEVYGFAVPFDYYDERIADCVKELGFAYGRDSRETYAYCPPEDYYFWSAGTYHVMPGFREFVEGFFEAEEELAFCQIVGHAYDLDVENMWEYMEDYLRRISEDDNIISLTNIEVIQYVKAIRGAYVSNSFIENNSDLDLWFEIDGAVVCLKPGEVWRRA